MYKYERIVWWSDEDDRFLVQVPELSGCMSDGKTVQEALENADVVIREWLEVNEEEGFPVPIPKGRPMYV